MMFLIFVGLTWGATTRRRRFIFGAAAALGGLQLLIGPFGWFHRYEVDASIFLVFFCMRVLAERPGFLFGYFALGLLFCASPYIQGTEDTSAASLEIYRQQYQMHRFVTDFYDGDYAINDLGLASFERRPGAYVLDVAGIGSAEAAGQQGKTADWMEGIVRRHGIHLAILYPEWFDIPRSWTPVARMCEPNEQRVIVSQRCVVFYSTTPDAAETIRVDLKRFVPTLPPEVLFYFGHPGGGDAMWAPAAVHGQ